MAPKIKPQQNAGQLPRDADFYNCSFKAEQMSRNDFLRGFSKKETQTSFDEPVLRPV